MDQHHEKYGVSTIPLPPSSLEDDYRKLEAELLDENGSSSAEARRTKKAKTEESEELPKYPDNVDAKTLARLKNRDQAKKSREKKKKAIEGMQAELDESRKKLKDQADFLERAQEKLKLYDEMVETNRKLAEENLRLQAILFPDPDDPLAMKTPGHGISDNNLDDFDPIPVNPAPSPSGHVLSLAHEFIDSIQNGIGWESGVELLCTDDDNEFHCDSMPTCNTIKQFADCMVDTTRVVFKNFRYIRKSSALDGDSVTCVCMAEGDHVAKGMAPPSTPPKRMSAMTVFSIRFTTTKHEGKKIDKIDLIFDSHTAYCQLGWPLVCFLKPKEKPRDAALVISGQGVKRGFKMAFSAPPNPTGDS